MSKEYPAMERTGRYNDDGPSLEAEIADLRHALATVRDDLLSGTITGEELHNIIDGINDALDRKG